MGFDNDCILNIQSLVGEYFCPVCHLLVYPNEALQAPCTHLYCKPCLTYVVSTNHACPYDGYRVTESDSKPLLESNKALAETIGKIQVHCLYYRTGCTWEGTLSECTSHCSTCAFGESPVLCNRCGVQIVHRQVQEHAQSCTGVQSQGQQPVASQDATSTGTGAASGQSQPVSQTGPPASQAQTTQASALPMPNQDANQPVNPATQPQATQASVPTPEQWYQQQQLYQQQYYQQYPGYDPNQQNYQYYYQYPQAAQQYQQQPMQVYGQAQPQAYGQTLTQPQFPSQQQPQASPQSVQPQSQPQVQPQTQPQVQPQSQPQVQPAINVQPQAQSVGQAQPQMHSQNQGPPSHTLPYNQSQPHPQAQHPQPYAQPHAVPQQQMQVPQYQQTIPQTHPHPQPYPQMQTQHYPYPQTPAQAQPQPHSQLPPAQPPSQPNQPVNPSAHLQAHGAVTGYHSYPQPQQNPQPQVGAAQQMHATGVQQQPQFPGHMQGHFQQPTQARPPQPYAALPNQQQPTTLSAQGQAPTAPPAQQPPVYNHTQQAGYPFPQRPGVQAAQQALPQQYGQGAYMQSHAQGSSQALPQPPQNYAAPHGVMPNMAQNYAGRQMIPQGAVPQPYAQPAGLAGSGQIRPAQPSQMYPLRADSQFPGSSEQPIPQKSSKTNEGEKPRDQMLERGVLDQNGLSKSGTGLTEAGIGNESKKDLSVESASEYLGSKQVSVTELQLVENNVQEGKPRSKEDAAGGTSAPSVIVNAGKGGAENNKMADVQDLKHAAKDKVDASSMLPESHLPSQVHGSNADQGRSQPQPMLYGSSAQPRPGVPSMSQSMPYPGNSQQSALLGHPPNQLRPHGPGEVPPMLPSHAVDNYQQSIHKHPPGSSVPFGRPGNVSPYQTDRSQNPHGESYVRPSFAGQHPGVFDSHSGAVGREAFPHPGAVDLRPQYPMEIDKFPAKRPGYFDGRLPDSQPHGAPERGPHGPAPPVIQPGASKLNGRSGHGSIPASGLCDERFKSFPEDHLKSFHRREFDDDFRSFPKHSEAGPSNFGSQFPATETLHRFGGDGLSRPFDKGLPGYDRESRLKSDSMRMDFAGGPGFHREHMDGLPPRSPGGEFAGFPSRTFGGYREMDGNESRPFEGPRPYNFPVERYGKSVHDNRFPIPPNRLHNELDVGGNLHMGDHLAGAHHNQDMMPSHLRRGEHMGPHSMHMGDGAAFGRSGGFPRMGEPLLGGNFPPHIPFGDSFGGEMPRHPLVGEPGFRSNFPYARDGGFYGEELEPFSNPRKRKLGSIMCRICKVECGTVEGLDLHSQSREHQRNAMDMVLNIKQQNKMKHKTSHDQVSVDRRNGSKPKTSGFDGRGNKR